MRHLISILIFTLCFLLQKSVAQPLSIDSLELIVKATADDTNKVIVYRMLTGLLRLTDPDSAILYGQSGVTLGKTLGFDKGIAGCYLNISACYSSLGQLDLAIQNVDSAIYYSHKAGEPNRLALAYLNRADAYMQLQKFDQSLKDCDTSLIYADLANNDDRRARVLQTIGSVYFYQKVLDRSAEYYQRANALYLKNGNLQMSAIVLNNLANVNKHTGQYQQATAFLQQAISIADSLNDLSNLSMYHGSLSDVYVSMEDFQSAETHAGIAMAYALKFDNDIQIANTWRYLGQVYLKQGRNVEGIEALSKGFEFFQGNGDLDRIHMTSAILADAYASQGNFTKAYEFLRISAETNDTLVKQRYDEDIASMQTRFRVDEKDKEIQLMNKGMQLQAQKIKEQRLMVTGAIVIAILALLGIALAISRFRLRNRVRELQLRNQIAADLHDDVGSSLSSIHMLSQIARQKHKDGGNEEILTTMSAHAKETMEKMGDIVWMIKPGEQEGTGLVQRMQKFMYDMCNEHDIETILDVAVLEQINLSMAQRKNLYLIFKEALNNAVKYAKASRIRVKSVIGNKLLQLIIDDNGNGFDTKSPPAGNGLKNMQQRAKELGGNLQITSIPRSGTTVTLSMPV